MSVFSFRALVTVEARGFSVERFLSVAAYNGVEMRNVTREGGALRFECAAAGFKRLKPFARKTGTRLKIIRRRGLPFAARRLKGRWALGLGFLFFIAALYLGASFVWQVDVEGLARIPRAEVFAFCEENGLKFGAFRYTIDNRRLERLLLARFEDAAWARVSIAGTRAVVTVAEALPGVKAIDRATPTDILAAKGGLIVKVTAGAGAPLVKPGDIAQAGDTLVSGKLTIGTEDTGFTEAYTHAAAEVWAKRYYEMRFSIPLAYAEKNYTGKTRKRYSIMVLNRRWGLPAFGRLFNAYTLETSESRPSLGRDYPLPVAWVTDTYREYAMARGERDEAEALAMARAIIERRVLMELPGAKIAARDVAYERDGGFVRVAAVVTAIERIDVERAITPPPALE